jgi:hypothetical protein
MAVRLYSHINSDGDLLDAWFRFYRRLGVESFHLIVHGPRRENTRLYAVLSSYPIVIEEEYEGEFVVQEKQRRLNRLLERDAGHWVLVVDSDEFLELPYRGLTSTIGALTLAGARALYAPMLQHLTANGSLQTPGVIDDPFLVQPRCSIDLYQRMGSSASINKYPLFHCGPGTRLTDGGNHNPPTGSDRLASGIRGVTHHFKFRSCVIERLRRRIDSAHTFRGESIGFQDYLARNGWQLPTDGTFEYSRAELFRRGLLRRPGLGALWRRTKQLVGLG